MDDITHLLDQLKSPDLNNRLEAIEKLRAASALPPKAKVALEHAVHDPDPSAAYAARRALFIHRQRLTHPISTTAFPNQAPTFADKPVSPRKKAAWV